MPKMYAKIAYVSVFFRVSQNVIFHLSNIRSIFGRLEEDINFLINGTCWERIEYSKNIFFELKRLS